MRRRRRVAIEVGMWRSGRIGGAHLTPTPSAGAFDHTANPDPLRVNGCPPAPNSSSTTSVHRRPSIGWTPPPLIRASNLVCTVRRPAARSHRGWPNRRRKLTSFQRRTRPAARAATLREILVDRSADHVIDLYARLDWGTCYGDDESADAQTRPCTLESSTFKAR